MAHRKASMKTKRALVLAAVALIAGSVAMGAANISNRIELNELYSDDNIIKTSVDLKSAVIVNKGIDERL